MKFYSSEGVEHVTPADKVIELEQAETAVDTEREWTIEREVFTRLCAHWFSAGPHPEEVLQRVFAATADRRPDLLGELTRHEITLAREESMRGRRWRLRALFAGRGEDWRVRYAAIVSTLSVAFAEANRPEIERMTLSEALCVGACRTEPREATETLSRVLERLFCTGCDPRCVVQQTFALTGWLFRDLQLNMSLDGLGKLFGEQRATQSWRSKIYVEGMLREAGFRGCKAGWQKPESAVDSYRNAAKGNQNRRNGRRFHSQTTKH